VREPVQHHQARVRTGQIDRRAAAARADDRRGLFQQRRRLPNSGQPFDASEQPFVEAAGRTRTQLQARGADDRVHHLPRRARDAAAGDQGRKEQRHRDRHPQAREQLLHRVYPQPPPVEVDEGVRTHQRPRL
jgi:hypothetical protein